MPSTAPSTTPLRHSAVLNEIGWVHSATVSFPARAAIFAAPSELPDLSGPAATLVASGGRLYRHQAAALRHLHDGHHVVVATGTGSGKTRVFHLAAADLLGREPTALTLALYPSKPLAREQAMKWREALSAAGIAGVTPESDVALLTGDQAVNGRARLLAGARVAVLTPDVLHSWLLAQLTDRRVRQALARTRLIVMDEAHTLAGVFGSNALLLLRRLQFALKALRAPAPRWIAASGTLASPGTHLETLVGHPFRVVGEDEDASPRFARHLHFVRPAAATSLSAGLQRWLHASTAAEDRFVVFTQGRKHTEVISLLANRAEDNDIDEESLTSSGNRVAPYRAGLDPDERASLQDRFSRGELRGLVCTSAFELGIDLPGLNLGFLIGLPESPASFWQRLGRFGRHGEAHIFLVDDGRARTAAFFEKPAALSGWQARDAALYPDNTILLARSALCLSHEASALGAESQVESTAVLPDPLRQFHAELLRGEPCNALREAQTDQGNSQPPHLAFPLRVCEETYTFKSANGSAGAPLGWVTYGQLMREAYPGAVYYHAGQPWRVMRLNRRDRTITVVRERGYHTQPRTIPATLLPDLSRPVLGDFAWSASDLRVIEAHARATEAVTGFTEIQGARSIDADYSQGAHGQSAPLFRTYETTAVLLCLPAFEAASPGAMKILGTSLREALILSCPREASEITSATGTLKAARRNLSSGSRFVAIYDGVAGSLRLSAALADPVILRRTLQVAAELTHERFSTSHEPEEVEAARLAAGLAGSADATPQHLPSDWPEASCTETYAPGTQALHRRRQLPVVIRRAFTDLDGGLHYEVTRTDDPAFHGTVAADALVEIPGVTTFVPVGAALCA